MSTARTFIILFLLYALVSTMDFIDQTAGAGVTPCDTDYECQQLNPHLGGY